MASCCSRDCCSWFCGLCCCWCGNRSKKEASALLHSRPASEEREAVMSQLQITPSPDGQSETQKVEVTVHSHEDNEEEEVMNTQPSPSRDSGRSCEVSQDPLPRDPATSTTFVRGSSGRSSWRMVPAKRHSQISSKEESAEQTAPVTAGPAGDGGQGTEVKEVTLDLNTTETPPPPPKDYRLTQSFEDDQSESVEVQGEGLGEGIVHTSSFSFSARDGRLVSTHAH